jgi:hypothetical protein
MKPEFRGMPDLQPAGKLAADKAPRAFQAFQRFLQLIVIAAQAIKVYVSVGKIRAHAGARDRDALETWVLDSTLHNVAQFSLHLIGDPVLTSLGHG